MEIYLTPKNVFINAGRYDDASWIMSNEANGEQKLTPLQRH